MWIKPSTNIASKRDEQAKAGDGADHAVELFTQILAHVLAFEPSFHVAAGFVGAALVGAAMQASGLPGHDFFGGGDGFF